MEGEREAGFKNISEFWLVQLMNGGAIHGHEEHQKDTMSRVQKMSSVGVSNLR